MGKAEYLCVTKSVNSLKHPQLNLLYHFTQVCFHWALGCRPVSTVGSHDNVGPYYCHMSTLYFAIFSRAQLCHSSFWL